MKLHFRLGVALVGALGLAVLGESSVRALSLEPTETVTVDAKDAFLIRPVLDQFNVDERMKKNVEFWVTVYSQYTTRQGIVHDAKYIDHIYEILDLRGGASGATIKGAKRKWKSVLLSLHHKQKELASSTPPKLTPDEEKVVQLFKDIHEPNKFLNAAHRKRLRFQLGQKDQFIEALKQSGQYISLMEEVFKKERMPVELTRLPFVESSFNLKARSKVGASGIWQFMRSTARLFVRMDAAVDERNDPIRATEAAAKLLKANYDSLGNWALAVTAYNHGRKGMMRAVRTIGSGELEDLTSEYRSRSFGFASSNFFAELLAAIEVEKNSEKYFGKIQKNAPLLFIEVKIPDFIEFSTLIEHLNVEKSRIHDMNPGLNETVLDGRLLVPKGYYFRVPVESGKTPEATLTYFWDRYAAIPSTSKQKTQRALKYDTKQKSVKHRLKNRAG